MIRNKNKKWDKIKGIGKKKFILFYGFLFGVMSSLIFIVFKLLLSSLTLESFWVVFILFISSPFWSYSCWVEMNRRYK